MTSFTQEAPQFEAQHSSILPVLNGRDEIVDYRRYMGDHDMLTLDQEIALAKRIEAGVYAEHRLAEGDVDKEDVPLYEIIVTEGEAAKDALVMANVRIAFSEVNKVLARGMYIPQIFGYVGLVQEGIIGMTQAAKRFDYTRQRPFAGIAFPAAKQAIKLALHTQGHGPHITLEQASIISMVIGARGSLRKDGVEPTPEQILDAVNAMKLENRNTKGTNSELLTLDDVQLAIEQSQTVNSLHAPVGDDGNQGYLGDLVVAVDEVDRDVTPEAAFNGYLRSVVSGALTVLTKREREVVELFFGLKDGIPRNKTDTGRLLTPPVTRPAVDFTLKSALKRLRNHKEVAAQLESYYNED